MKHWLLSIALTCFGSIASATPLGVYGKMDLAPRPFMVAQGILPPPPAPGIPAPGIQNNVDQLAPVLAHLNGMQAQIFKSSWYIGVNANFDSAYIVADRDWYNGMTLFGYGYEAFPISYKQSDGQMRDWFYVGVQNLYDTDEGGRGSVGPTFGVKASAIGHVAAVIGDTAATLVHLNVQPGGHAIPPWVVNAGNYCGIEVGYARRFRAIQGASSDEWTAGFKLKYPFSSVHQ